MGHKSLINWFVSEMNQKQEKVSRDFDTKPSTDVNTFRILTHHTHFLSFTHHAH